MRAVRAVALHKRFLESFAVFRVAKAGLIGYALAVARANIVLHIFHYTIFQFRIETKFRRPL